MPLFVEKVSPKPEPLTQCPVTNKINHLVLYKKKSADVQSVFKSLNINAVKHKSIPSNQASRILDISK